ncbi:MAG: hypothetical protein K0R29_2797, partial [Pseudobdellovibrio sp.]|nr:hypothetical protein [Pseudobdellovibrio sp.]
ILARQHLGSVNFKESLNAFFGIGVQKNMITWCVDNTVDVLWTNAEVAEKMKEHDLRYLRNHYCELPTEPIAGVDLDKVTWSPLAESKGPAGQLSKLEWNQENGVFRAGGMPFKSTAFAEELKTKLSTQ